MDYISSPHIIDSINHADIDYIDTQSEVYFDYSGFPVDGSANASSDTHRTRKAQWQAHYNSCWDDPALAAIAHQFLPQERVSWPEITSISSSSLSMPSPDAGPLFLGMPGVNQPVMAQPSSAGRSPEVQRDYLYSPSPVRSQPAIISAKDYQDQILKEDRLNGWSYKKIRAVRNFGVTESTLCGRYRNLIKRSHDSRASEKPNLDRERCPSSQDCGAVFHCYGRQSQGFLEGDIEFHPHSRRLPICLCLCNLPQEVGQVARGDKAWECYADRVDDW
ncbi:hypothetical protein E4U30_006994 [Claviceps sp. LM220 group G6]|nr:hypothetical protein E4U30_006994 [Claviceps sp. LM220 group G6]